MNELRYIPNYHQELGDKETYCCLNERCGFRWRGSPGAQKPCIKCGSSIMKWETFETDWVLIDNDWKRKDS